MESIVKMGVSGKNTYGKNEQRAGADIYSPPGKGAYQDLNRESNGKCLICDRSFRPHVRYKNAVHNIV